MDNVDIETYDDHNQITAQLLYKQEHDHPNIQEILMDHIIKYSSDRDHPLIKSIRD